MAQISRSTKVGGGTVLQSNTLARAVDVETDMLTLVTAHNNHDTGVSIWQVGSFSNATSTPLITNNSSGTNDIFEAKDNGVSAFKIADGGNITFTGKQLGPDGTAALPTFAFSSDAANGLYLDAADTLGLTTNGVKRLSISTAALTAALPLAMGTNKITGIGNGTAVQDAGAYGQIKILQVVRGISTSSVSTSSATFSATNLTASITPSSASNKVLVIACGQAEAGGGAMAFTFLRAGSDVLTTDGFSRYTSSTAAQLVPVCGIYLDSPSSTSALTYALAIRAISGTVQFGTNSTTQVIILMEVNGL